MCREPVRNLLPMKSLVPFLATAVLALVPACTTNDYYATNVFTTPTQSAPSIVPEAGPDAPAAVSVTNDGEYLQKDFLIPENDPGWMFRATVTQVSTPNPLGADFLVMPGL